jgi:predicted Rossmann-fold nucleotide-binding protein
LFDTEGRPGYWNGIDSQIKEMITRGRAPDWIQDNIVITDDPKNVIDAYRTRLQLF